MMRNARFASEFVEWDESKTTWRLFAKNDEESIATGLFQQPTAHPSWMQRIRAARCCWPSLSERPNPFLYATRPRLVQSRFDGGNATASDFCFFFSASCFDSMCWKK